MQYIQQLSERALDCLTILNQPTWKEIWKQRTGDYVGDVGTKFNEILDEMDISIHVLRKLLQKELYGIVGVFFQTLDVTHSVSFVSNEFSDANYDRITKNGFEPRFSNKGNLYQAKTKKNHPRQKGLYLPESVLENFEEAIDHEERLFVKNINLNSLDVLNYMFDRSLELRKKHGNNWYPIFSDKSISRDTKIEYKTVINSTKDLVGIICESYKMKNCRIWQKRYFLPSSKFVDVKTILKK